MFCRKDAPAAPPHGLRGCRPAAATGHPRAADIRADAGRGRAQVAIARSIHSNSLRRRFMIHAHRVLAVLAIGMLPAACNQKPATPAAKVDNVATIDGKSISRTTFNEFAKNVAGKPAEDLTPEQRKDLLDNLV